MGKYQSLNVLSQKKPSEYMSDDAIKDVANMINASGENRSQRRRIERSLRKVENITAHAQKHLDYSAYKHYQKAVGENYVHFFACLGLTMIEQYGWRETPDNNHGQISSLIERVDNTIKKYAKQECTTEDLVEKFEEITGISLVAEQGAK